MNETTNRDILIASDNPKQIARIKRILELVFKDRPEHVNWHEARSVQGAIQVLGRLEKTLIPLVVTAGFDGEWFEVIGRAEQIALDEIQLIMMTGNEADAKAAFGFGIYVISTMLDEVEAAALAANLLFGNLHDFNFEQVNQPGEADSNLDIHSA